jgi:uncharacterized protein YacL
MKKCLEFGGFFPARAGFRLFEMALIILRCVFLMVAAALAAQLSVSPLLPKNVPWWTPWGVFVGVMGLSLAVVALDVVTRRKRLDTLTAVYFGLIVGLFLTYVLRLALTTVLPERTLIAQYAELALGMLLCYTCISMLLQTKDDFRFIIPYVEFAKDVKGIRPYVFDTSVVIDGRIADVIETQILDNQLIMPRFVIAELQAIADSSDRLRRSRGRRGLDILNRLRSNPAVDLQIYDHELAEFAGQPVDIKLVLLAKHLNGKVVTNDYNLNKVARLHGVGVINLNELANALKPTFLPGEHVEVRIVKTGEEPGQGVGYLDDGTMIVVEGGREHVNKQVRIIVTSVLQTSAGRMIFGRYEGLTTRAADDEAHASRKSAGTPSS